MEVHIGFFVILWELSLGTDTTAGDTGDLEKYEVFCYDFVQITENTGL
jgi:hypothetical protein